MNNSINPEVMMRSLNNKLKTLFIHSLVLDNKDIEENFKKLLRKTLISEYLFELQISIVRSAIASNPFFANS